MITRMVNGFHERNGLYTPANCVVKKTGDFPPGKKGPVRGENSPNPSSRQIFPARDSPADRGLPLFLGGRFSAVDSGSVDTKPHI